ncbi:MAG: PQQ-binding-like beta-propeller repeat protein [Candidatus Sumerlaeia bacterium]
MRKYRISMGALLLLAFLIAYLPVAQASGLEEMLGHYPTKRGVACVPDCGEADLALELAQKSEFLILALDPDETKIAAAKRKASEAGVLGRSLYVEQGQLRSLPFADNYVDLLALPNKTQAELSEAEAAEIMRVLTPVHGRAFLKDHVIEKPEQPGSDWWPHKLHGPNNNQVSEDTIFQWPPILQFRAMPFYNAHTGSALTAEGRHIEIHDWTVKNPERSGLTGRLFVRNSYNGRLLWKDYVPENVESNMPIYAAADGLLFLGSGTGPEVVVRNLDTGFEKSPLVLSREDKRVKWLAVESGVLYALLGDPTEVRKANMFALQPRVFQEQEANNTLFGSELVAWNLGQGKTIWQHREPVLIDFRAVAVDEGNLYFYSENKRLACLDAQTGKLLWENTEDSWMKSIKRPAKIRNHNIRHMSTMSVADGLVRLAILEGNRTFIFSADNGKLRTTIDEGRFWGGQKSFILDGKYVKGSSVVDLSTGERSDETIDAPAGLAWCGIATYAPGIGALGHGTLDYKSPCGVGAWVAGGILQYSPTVCGCGAMQGGAGFASGGPIFERIQSTPEHPLVQGAAFNKSSDQKTKAREKDWTAYLGDSRHRGSSQATVSEKPTIAWEYKPDNPFAYSQIYNQFMDKLDERPSPPIVVGEYVYTAGSDGVVRAIRLNDGKVAWEFCADGPIFTSPAYWEGNLYVPCADGWVYGLNATSGDLVWKRRLAPVDRRIHVFDQFVSTWPVYSLAVEAGVVYAAAGMLKVNGSKTFALNADSGDIIWEHYIEPEISGSHLPPTKRTFGYNGHTAIAGDHVWIAGYISMPLILDRKTGALPELSEFYQKMRIQGYHTFNATYYTQGKNVLIMDDKNVLIGGSHLIENQHLREGKRGRMEYSLYFLNEHGAPDMDTPPPNILNVARVSPVCDDDLVVFAAQPPGEEKKGQIVEARKRSMASLGLSVWDKKTFVDEGRAMRAKPLVDETASKGKRLHFTRWSEVFRLFDYSKAAWQKPELDVSALALASNAVLAAHASAWSEPYGWGMEMAEKDNARIQFEGWKISAFGRKDGAEKWSIALSSEPLQNGIAIAADGTVIVAFRDGSVVCLK